jgi:hypothetical protein
MTADPFSDPFYIPHHQAVMIFHESFENSVGRVALIVPTFTPGLSHLGIAHVNGKQWTFIYGPAIVHTKRVWRKLLQLNGYCPSASVLFEKTDDWSIPTASPDDLIDLVTGRKPA